MHYTTKTHTALVHKVMQDSSSQKQLSPRKTASKPRRQDAVEKAVITSEMIAAGGDDLDEVRQALESGRPGAFSQGSQYQTAFLGVFGRTSFWSVRFHVNVEASQPWKPA